MELLSPTPAYQAFKDYAAAINRTSTSSSAPRSDSIVDRLLSLRELCGLLKLSKSTIYNKLKAGDFPPPIRLSSRCTRWRSSDISLWVEYQRQRQ